MACYSLGEVALAGRQERVPPMTPSVDIWAMINPYPEWFGNFGDRIALLFGLPFGVTNQGKVAKKTA